MLALETPWKTKYSPSAVSQDVSQSSFQILLTFPICRKASSLCRTQHVPKADISFAFSGEQAQGLSREDVSVSEEHMTSFWKSHAIPKRRELARDCSHGQYREPVPTSTLMKLLTKQGGFPAGPQPDVCNNSRANGGLL